MPVTREAVWLCLFEEGDDSGATEREDPARGACVRLVVRFVPGMGDGQRYAYRVDGPWDPANGLRHNVDKLLLDPYAKAIEGSIAWGPEVWRPRGGRRMGR